MPRISRRELVTGAIAATAWSRAGRVLAQSTDPIDLTLLEASGLIRSGMLSPLELTQSYLAAIERLEPQVNAYITITEEVALEQARALAAELDAGRWRGPLHGIPIALKDNIDTAGILTTAAGAVLANRVPDEDAEVYTRLRDAGAVLLGKLNMHEYAYGGTSSITHFSPVHNPWNLDHIPGGSSGGSAAAVAARMCAASLGTDTLASIRLPAAYCGVVGLKATHGLASIRGIVPVSESLDHVGPLTRTVGDTAVLLDAIAGFDPRDPVSIRAPRVPYASVLFQGTSELRIGLPREPYFGVLQPDVAAAMDEALVVLRGLTADIRDVTLPAPPEFAVLLAEAYAYHEPFLRDPAERELYDPVTLERLLAAGEFSTVEYYAARRELALSRHAIDSVFDDVDLLVTPTAPGLPELIRDAQNPAQASGAEPSVRNTYPFNLYGIPTISVPCGFSRSGLPIGLQISGPRLGELAVLTLAHAYEQATEWHRRRPPVLG
jgi:aspartyl-tRNA(Asn)/glutamyl-tRNA(Gln) amidotransferase subunit A